MTGSVVGGLSAGDSATYLALKHTRHDEGFEVNPLATVAWANAGQRPRLVCVSQVKDTVARRCWVRQGAVDTDVQWGNHFG